MRQLFEAGLTQTVSSPHRQTLLPAFNGVYITDCTRLVWGKTGLKLGVRWELQHGQLQARLHELQQHDQKSPVLETRLPAGALHLGDLGFFKLARFADWSQQGVYWLTRFKLGTRVYYPDGSPLDLLTLVTACRQPLRLSVRIGAKAQLAAELLIAPLGERDYQQRMVRLREQARLDQRPLSARQAAFARWTLYLTNIPGLTFDQAHLLARTRWQIELLFKLWKSHGQVLRSRSADPIRQQCEGYGKLLGVMIAHWLLLVTGWQAMGFSALDALRLVRTHVPLLMRALTQPALWPLCFDWLGHDILHLPPLSRRRKTPLAFQLWQDFDLVLP